MTGTTVAEVLEEAPLPEPWMYSSCSGLPPFGGFKMSGTDQKTGSPDYLFLERDVK